jgi:hypothetical protein
MNVDLLPNTFDLLVHNIRDNIIKVVRLERNTDSFIDNSTLVHNYIQHFKKSLNEPLECKFTTDQTIEFHTIEKRTTTGYLYNTTKKVNVLVYQIKCIEILETYPFSVSNDSLPPLVTDSETQYIPPPPPQNTFTPYEFDICPEPVFPKSQFLDELTNRLEKYKFGLSRPYNITTNDFPHSGITSSHFSSGHLLD